MPSRKFRAACVQNNAGSNLEKNLAGIYSLTAQALKHNPALIAFPENFLWRGPSRDLASIAKRTPALIRAFQTIAKKTNTAFLLGSLIEFSEKKNRYYNTSFFISERGTLSARYRKIHLFSIALKNIRTDESSHLDRGNKIVTVKTGSTVLGLSICYDLRFPELYRKLVRGGAKILAIPSNFTYTTGKAHWETLLRARAIENQAFVIAPGQAGMNPSNSIRSFGTSLIVDPWGKVLAKGQESREEIIFADLDLAAQDTLRRQFPVLKHRVL